MRALAAAKSFPPIASTSMSQATAVARAELQPSDSINNASKIGKERVRAVVQSIAELRRYFLVEQPSMLKEAAPCLVAAESEILNLWGRMG